VLVGSKLGWWKSIPSSGCSLSSLADGFCRNCEHQRAVGGIVAIVFFVRLFVESFVVIVEGDFPARVVLNPERVLTSTYNTS